MSAGERSLGLGPQARTAVRAAIAETAARSERLICVARIAIAIVSLGRSWSVWASYGYSPGSSPVLLGPGAAIALLSLSALTLVRFRARAIPMWLLGVSVSVDSLACFGALLTGLVDPHPTYPGLLGLPDVAAIVALGAATALRLSPGLAVLAGCLNVIGVVAIVALDHHLGYGPPASELPGRVSSILILLGAATSVSALTASRTRHLAWQGALRAVRIEQAESNLGTLMQDHHDVRTLLSSASLNADLVLRRLARDAPRAELRELAQQIRRDLDHVNEFVVQIRDRSYEDLLALQAMAPVEVTSVFARVAEQLASRFPSVEIAVEGHAPALASVVGGDRALARLALNLLVNACEGDGAAGASKVHVLVRREGGTHVVVDVQDDGPGLPPPLNGDTTAGYSTKRDGAGLGLSFIRQVVHASHGHSVWQNDPGGGAHVTVALPAAPSRRPSAAP